MHANFLKRHQNSSVNQKVPVRGFQAILNAEMSNFVEENFDEM